MALSIKDPDIDRLAREPHVPPLRSSRSIANRLGMLVSRIVSGGKGRYPAGLNFGDCFSYALSKTSGEPLCFKGKDFALPDIHRVRLG